MTWLPDYQRYWALLYLLAAVQAIASIVGTNVFQTRHHNGIRITNDILVRMQLAFVTFCFALLINANLVDQKETGVTIALLGAFALIGFLGGLRFSSQTNFEKAIGRAKHVCPATLDSPCRLGWLLGTKLLWFNILFFLVSFVLASYIVRSLKPATPVSIAPIRQKATGAVSIRAIPYKDSPEWYEDHLYWLSQEGDRQQRQKLIGSHSSGEASYTLPASTVVFEIVLRVPDKYGIVSRAAFRQTTAGERPVVERLAPRTPQGNLRELRVRVPVADKGDRIVVLFRVGSQDATVSLDLADIVKSTLE